MFLSLFISACSDRCLLDLVQFPLNTVLHFASLYGDRDDFSSCSEACLVIIKYFNENHVKAESYVLICQIQDVFCLQLWHFIPSVRNRFTYTLMQKSLDFSQDFLSSSFHAFFNIEFSVFLWASKFINQNLLWMQKASRRL